MNIRIVWRALLVLLLDALCLLLLSAVLSGFVLDGALAALGAAAAIGLQRRSAGRLVPGSAAVGIPDDHPRRRDHLPANRQLD
jgi:hypothetical protein